MDIQAIKDAAEGRWDDLLVKHGGFDPAILNGKHHPCPLCGGRDRFRAFNDGSGGVICNQCFSSENGDGIEAIRWKTGKSRSEVLRILIYDLGLENGNGKPKRGRPKKKSDFQLTFIPWSDDLAALWCIKNQPITVDSLKKFGAKLGIHQGHTVVAIPIRGDTLAPSHIVGWVMFNQSGAGLPTGADGKLMKQKTAPGSKSGLIGPVDQLRLSESARIWKCEGVKDALALDAILPLNHFAITNASGAKEKPREWMCKIAKGRTVYVIHDADEPGLQGATYVKQTDGSERPGWAPMLAVFADEVRHVRLPFELKPDHGHDLRDWMNAGHGFDELEQLAASSEVIKPPEDGQETFKKQLEKEIFTAEDDPHYLAEIVIHAIEKKGRKLVRWQGWWELWTGKAYRRCSVDWIESKISRVCMREFDRQWIERAEKEDEPKPRRKVTVSLIRNVEAAMASMVHMNDDAEFGSWVDLESGEFRRRNILSLQNGLLDIDRLMVVLKETKGEATPEQMWECLMPHSPEWFSEVVLPYGFAPEADCPTWRRIVRENLAGDMDQIQLLQQWMGYNLISNTRKQKFLICEGDGGNGKSAILAGMEAILGSANVSHVSLGNFSSRFDKISTIGKLANITHDAGEIDRKAVDQLKSFTSGDKIHFDRKNQPAVEIAPTARLTLACNNLPNWGDKSEGIWRRILLLEFREQIEPSVRIEGLDDPTWWEKSGELSGMLRWALAGLYSLQICHGGKFTISQKILDRIEEYRVEINTARAFLKDEIEAAISCRIECTEIYRRYSEWCRDRGNHPQAIQSFGRELKRLFHTSERKRVKIDGSLKYVYTGIGFRSEISDIN